MHAWLQMVGAIQYWIQPHELAFGLLYTVSTPLGMTLTTVSDHSLEARAQRTVMPCCVLKLYSKCALETALFKALRLPSHGVQVLRAQPDSCSEGFDFPTQV